MGSLPKSKKIRSEKYKNWIRQLPCVICLMKNPYLINRTVHSSEPHHIPRKGGASLASKTDDTRCIPLCGLHHKEYHRGRESFAERYDIDYEYIISRLNSCYPGKL